MFFRAIFSEFSRVPCFSLSPDVPFVHYEIASESVSGWIPLFFPSMPLQRSLTFRFPKTFQELLNMFASIFHRGFTLDSSSKASRMSSAP